MIRVKVSKQVSKGIHSDIQTMVVRDIVDEFKNEVYNRGILKITETHNEVFPNLKTISAEVIIIPPKELRAILDELRNITTTKGSNNDKRIKKIYNILTKSDD